MNLIILAFLLFTTLASAQSNFSSLIPKPFYEVHNKGENSIMSIDDGMAAMQIRIEMIKRATKTIEVEYFIFNDDLAGKIILRDLLAAAKRGVKVRILVDKSSTVVKLDEYFAHELAQNGIDLRFYNKAPLHRISSTQFRNHRKLMVVDDVEALTGGRNIGDDYFDMSHHFNFYDRDVYIKGPMAKAMRLSFDKFFEHKISEQISFVAKELNEKALVKFKKRNSEVKLFLEETQEEINARAKFGKIGKANLEKVQSFKCPEMSFSTDAPGANLKERLHPDYDDRYRFLRKTLDDKIAAIDKSLLISSPYMIHNSKTRKLINHLHKKNVDITLYTNSLASTDAVYVAANLYIGLMKWKNEGINVFLHDGKYMGHNSELDPEVQASTWGTHCKTQVYETTKYTEVMIGTYNADNRSNFYNAEMAIFCKGNDAFTKVVKDDILLRAKNGYEVNMDGSATDRDGIRKSIYGADTKNVLFMQLITFPSWILKFLI